MRGIYSFELYKFYGVENIIRVGSCGGLLPEMDLYDVILETAAFSDSTYAKVAFGYEEDLMYPDEELTNKLAATAERLGRHIYKGIGSSGDCFYADPEVRAAHPKNMISLPEKWKVSVFSRMPVILERKQLAFLQFLIRKARKPLLKNVRPLSAI